jgi:DNA-binding transcriptional MerR regulator
MRAKVGFMSSGNTPGAVTYSIGEVAARFGVAVSALRWWEKRGLIAPSARQSGRRRYRDRDVRRIAMIQMWQSAAAMSLDEIRALLVGNTGDASWRAAVQGRIAACDEQIARLRSARSVLARMLECPSDHPAESCPYLAATIDEYLATGQLPPALLSAPEPPGHLPRRPA